jgi:hypothetical protein
MRHNLNCGETFAYLTARCASTYPQFRCIKGKRLDVARFPGRFSVLVDWMIFVFAFLRNLAPQYGLSKLLKESLPGILFALMLLRATLLLSGLQWVTDFTFLQDLYDLRFGESRLPHDPLPFDRDSPLFALALTGKLTEVLQAKTVG